MVSIVQISSWWIFVIIFSVQLLKAMLWLSSIKSSISILKYFSKECKGIYQLNMLGNINTLQSHKKGLVIWKKKLRSNDGYWIYQYY